MRGLSKNGWLESQLLLIRYGMTLWHTLYMYSNGAESRWSLQPWQPTTHWPDHPQTTPLILTGDPTELTDWMRKPHNCIACNNCTNKRWMQLCVRCSCYRMAHCRMNKMKDYNFWTRWMSREDNVDSEWLWRGLTLVFMVKRLHHMHDIIFHCVAFDFETVATTYQQ